MVFLVKLTDNSCLDRDGEIPNILDLLQDTEGAVSIEIVNMGKKETKQRISFSQYQTKHAEQALESLISTGSCFNF